MPKTKKHTTVTITREMLEELGACKEGFEAALPLLPATLSTDPEQNLELALELTQSKRAEEEAWDDSWWLMCAVLPERRMTLWSDYDRCGLLHGHDCKDPSIVAQRLAAVADFIATREGR